MDDFPEDERDNDLYPNFQERTHHCFAILIEPQNQIFSDLMGRMVIPSSNGNQYIFVLYDYDSNAILVTAIPNCQAKTIKDAFAKLHRHLVLAGLRPKLQHLDNKVSSLLTDFMDDEGI